MPLILLFPGQATFLILEVLNPRVSVREVGLGVKSLKLLLLSGAQSESAQSKMLSGIGGFVLGLLFLVVGLFIYFRNQKGKAPVGSWASL